MTRDEHRLNKKKERAERKAAWHERFKNAWTGSAAETGRALGVSRSVAWRIAKHLGLAINGEAVERARLRMLGPRRRRAPDPEPPRDRLRGTPTPDEMRRLGLI